MGTREGQVDFILPSAPYVLVFKGFFMRFLFFGVLILLHTCAAFWFYLRGRDLAGVFNVSCISLLVYLLLMKP